MYRTGIISIIVPIHNTEKYLEQCVESILQQTYTNLEVILIDDNSSDRCGEICDRFAEKDARVIVAHVKAGSAGAARNVGLDMASGEYIGFVDSDDWIEKNMYEAMQSTMEATKTVCVMCEKASHSINGEITHYRFDPSLEHITSLDAIQQLCVSVRQNNKQKVQTVFVWDKLYCHEIWDSLRFDEKLYIAEDRDALFAVFRRVDKIGICHNEGYHHREQIGVSKDGKTNNEAVYLTGYKIYKWAMANHKHEMIFVETIILHSLGRVRASVAFNNRKRYFETAREFKNNWPNLKRALHGCEPVFLVLALGLRFIPHLMWLGLRVIAHFKDI